ncbi:MAG: hypothetical protein CM15mP93_12210 [Thiotrichaceae bacterium]|nr:MAG: hypothetical protein CM15mP93_12210 [Thiotrichaceae bacterium]
MKIYQDILMNKNILGVNKINKYSFSITLKNLIHNLFIG